MGTKVRAIADGFAMSIRRRKGAEFTLPSGVKPGKWMVVLEEDVAAKSKAETEAEQKAAAEAKAKADAEAVKKANDDTRNIAPVEATPPAPPARRTPQAS